MIKKIDLSDIDVSKITSLNNMLPLALKKVKYYDKIDYIDVWGWDVKNIEDMSNTFAYELVHKIDGLDSWNVSNVKNMQSMFQYNSFFNGEGIENWDVSNVENMSNMFYNCWNFDGKSIKNWNVSNVKDMSICFMVVLILMVIYQNGIQII